MKSFLVVLRERSFGESTEQYRPMGSGEDIITMKLYTLFYEVDIIKNTKINRLRWAGHVTFSENEKKIVKK
jgi:hypothetical protein